MSSRIDVTAGGPEGSIASSTEFLLHFDLFGFAVPAGERPQINTELPPVRLEYNRTIRLSDTSGRNVDVRVHGLVACDFARWQQQMAGKQPSFATFLALAGTKHYAGFEVNGAGPLQAYSAFFSSHGESIAAQSDAATSGLSSATPGFAGSDVPGLFVKPDTTAADRFGRALAKI